MTVKTSMVATLLAGFVLLAGCSSDVTMYKPGVYKGKQDETASRQAAENRSDDLRSRATRGFADR
jgi:PBP1b-binding outer membrane lipoprotein LpoB